nr:MAG TPA: hypothetical protein [Caudoviricetes sp.]
MVVLCHVLCHFFWPIFAIIKRGILAVFGHFPQVSGSFVPRFVPLFLAYFCYNLLGFLTSF